MNIIFFGPNGSGKGTQSDFIKDKFSLAHLETGNIFREHVSNRTELGEKASVYMDRGALVPDEITIPMVLEALGGVKAQGWLLDGFPRNIGQARYLLDSLTTKGIKLTFVIEIELERNIAKTRIMGRRICNNSPHHPNNIYIEAIKPKGNHCHVCGSTLTSRKDDQNEAAINKRHDIYYDNVNGTLAAVSYLVKKSLAKHIRIDGNQEIEQLKNSLLSKLDL